MVTVQECCHGQEGYRRSWLQVELAECGLPMNLFRTIHGTLLCPMRSLSTNEVHEHRRGGPATPEWSRSRGCIFVQRHTRRYQRVRLANSGYLRQTGE